MKSSVEALEGNKVKLSVEVDEAEWRVSLEVHRRYNLEHIEKLPDWTAYRSASVPRDDAPADARRVVFLQQQGQDWAFTARGSLEPVSELARVKQALSRSAGPRAPRTSWRAASRRAASRTGSSAKSPSTG